LPEDESLPQLGLSADPISASEVAVDETAPAITVIRPFLKVDICASVVPDSKLDAGRWYRYSAGIGAAPGDENPAVLDYIREDGQRVNLAGKASLISCNAMDSLSGQSCSMRFPLTGLMLFLLPRLRPMDRVRVTVTVPGYPDWLVFDGLVRSIRSSRRAGSGWNAEVIITAGGLETLLGGAIFNWQGFVHAASDILQGAEGKMLVEAVGKSAKAPHLILQAFLESVLNSSMGLQIGDPEKDGLDVLDYALFPQNDPKSWGSWADVAYPLPWSLIQGQSGQSFWAIAQAISEPTLHEFFTGYRKADAQSEDPNAPLRPSLIHRPRPVPGRKEWDAYWLGLTVAKVGGEFTPCLMGTDDSLSLDRRANTFHWGGMGLGDHSTEAFNAKLFWGWASSFELVNRYGYASHSVVSKLSPIAPGAPIQDYLQFAKDHLLHFAFQEAPLTLLQTRSVDGVFLPVRPGEVLEDHSLGSAPDKVVTGYVVSTDFSLRTNGDSVAMSMGAQVDRCIAGTDALGYPDKIRALLSDLKLHSYAGQDAGSPGPHPAVTSTYTPPQPTIAPPPGIAEKIRVAIFKARDAFKVPGWLIGHILLNETSMGRNMGDETMAKNGIAQITDVALADLVAIGHLNPDGTPFSSADRLDVAKCIYACGHYLARCQELIMSQPGGYPASGGSDFYSWVCRSYRYGAASARAQGAAWNWAFPPAGEPYPDYARYWSPDGVEKGRKVWGWLG
jgi:hypothetical protein